MPRLRHAAPIFARLKRADTQGVAPRMEFLALRDASADAKLPLFEAVVLHSADGIMITEAEPIERPGPRILFTNPAVTAMTGYSAEELIGQSPRIFQGPLSDPAVVAKIRAALEAWQPVQAEILNYRKDGTMFWVELSIVPVSDETGWYTHWISVQRDITERKREQEALRQSENLLARTALAAGIGGWSIDIATEEVVLSDETYRIYGLEPGQPLDLETAINFYAPEARDKLVAAVAAASRDGVAFDLEIPLIRADGERTWTRAIGSTEFADGKPVRIFGLFQDIDRQVRKRLALQQANEALTLARQAGDIGIWVWDFATDEIVCDATIREIYGVPDVDSVSFRETWLTCLHEQDREAAAQALREGAAGSRDFNLQYRIIRPDGALRHIRASGILSRDPAGQALRMTGALWDITKGVAETIALQDATARIKLATDSGGIGIWEWDVVSDVVVWDNRLLQLYDVDPSTLAITYEIWTGCLHPEDRAAAEQGLADAVGGTGEFDACFRIVWRDGSVHHIRAVANVERDAAGAALRVLGVNWDVTREVSETLALQEVTTRMTLAADAGEIGILELDLQRNLMVADAWACRILGGAHLPGAAVPAEVWKLCVHPEDRERRDQARRDAIAGIAPYQLEYRIIHGDGTIRHLNCSAQITRDAEGRPLRMTGPIRDITERKIMDMELLQAAREERRLAEALQAGHELLSVTLKSIGDAVVRTDQQGNVTFTNATAEKLLGVPPCAWIRPPMPEIERMIEASSQKAALTGGIETMSLPEDYVLSREAGGEIAIEGCVAPLNSRDAEAGKIIVFRDVTASRAIVNQTRHAAYHDNLTDLPNRLLLLDRIRQAIARAPRHGMKMAVLFMDLDGFKHVNDSLGHEIGDKLLKSVSSRLVACVRGSDTVSRQGGDEFVMLLDEMIEPEDGAITARRILAAIGQTHTIDGHELQITASIGIAVYPKDGLDGESLLKAADTAMYKVKASGRHGYQFFEAAMRAGAIERQYIEESLRRAIRNGEFVLHYQPKISLRTGGIIGAEALLRWNHPERGLISPALFIPVAEDCGLIRKLGSWVLREACEQGRRWMQAGLPPITMAVNVSPIELGKPDFLGDVRAILEQTGFAPKHLELEMTEGVMMKGATATVAILKALKQMGLRLAIDDFGTGYSSLSYLTKFPIDTIKIDQSFVRLISEVPSETAIVTAVISMAHSLNLMVVAEGVETQKELEFLSKLGCDEAQGYYFSRPIAAAAFTRLLCDAAAGVM